MLSFRTALLPAKAPGPRRSRGCGNIFQLPRAGSPCRSPLPTRPVPARVSFLQPATHTAASMMAMVRVLRFKRDSFQRRADFRRPFVTRPERMQEVQTRTCLRAPLITAFTRRRLGFQRRRVTLCAWLIVLPYLRLLAAHFTCQCHCCFTPDCINCRIACACMLAESAQSRKRFAPAMAAYEDSDCLFCLQNPRNFHAHFRPGKSRASGTFGPLTLRTPNR